MDVEINWKLAVYANFARVLGLQETTVKNLVHRLREPYRALLREEVAETVGGAKRDRWRVALTLRGAKRSGTIFQQKEKGELRET